MFTDKTILITGGTGSFGKRFAKTVLTKHPEVKKVIIFSRDEYKQFVMEHSPEFLPDKEKLRFFIGDVRDKERLLRAFEGVDYVVHAAALKQVPSCEYNPFEAVKTNVLGAQNVINVAMDQGVQKVVALSTDKACSPINLYGATKLCSDKLFIAGNLYVGSKPTRFSVVRYGNVAGSRGSVIPFFQKLVAEGAGELPITDLRMTRFWLKLGQAVEMVLTALERMHGGELYVKKIPSMRMPDLAEAVAPGLKIKEIGIRPGEKIHEQMITAEDARNTLDLGEYYIILPQIEMEYVRHSYPGAKPVAPDFEYHSGNNDSWLSVEEMRRLISELE
ncbi:UDP-glucose 4-epimerase [Candidatus Termititenax persephonae]|uniref:UDP-glucose 4-epimerase n=1 Tax=Candidatus Termititenax persephonae TaxID=2218525 RepID=A0A388TIX5_9BACT|nr:UDP-glucose 4-epimerase [Candidatus Termititenax persephonae]